jgi:hypothetical protein
MLRSGVGGWFEVGSVKLGGFVAGRSWEAGGGGCGRLLARRGGERRIVAMRPTTSAKCASALRRPGGDSGASV